MFGRIIVEMPFSVAQQVSQLVSCSWNVGVPRDILKFETSSF
jgi:hypothetical protein